MMEYSNQETKIIYEMKRSIINEFRYRYSNTDIGFLANFVEPDLSIDVDSLQEAFRMGMSDQEKRNLRKYKFLDLFDQALVELFHEGFVSFRDSKIVVMTDKGETTFIFPDRWYTRTD